jgi:hypothetical protein
MKGEIKKDGKKEKSHQKMGAGWMRGKKRKKKEKRKKKTMIMQVRDSAQCRYSTA